MIGDMGCAFRRAVEAAPDGTGINASQEYLIRGLDSMSERSEAMAKVLGLNKHQKAARKRGEQEISRSEIAELIDLSHSGDPTERLEAAKHLCPCHVKGYLPEVWEAVYRMMEDAEPRVRFQAWHTLEDGGIPKESGLFERLEAIYRREADPKVKRFARFIFGEEMAAHDRVETARRNFAATKTTAARGKCDFCGETGIFVERNLDTMIPADPLPRAAFICAECARDGL